MTDQKPEIGEDTFNRASQLVDTTEFRVETAKQVAKLDWLVSSLRRWIFVVVAVLALNWAHDLGVSVEMFDWWDGRTEGLLSSEIEQEITVLTPLLLALVPILWGRRRDRLARLEHERQQKEEE
jgi:hypothetical protein